ncbi:MAG TPA: MFS transporter, partial [Pirellulales bacterium]|nr:MFS transporter [Pirellulales bacterium]
TYLFSFCTSYPALLLCAALFGLSGNSFTAGIAWNSAWFPDRSKGTALGVFGAGNVGASGTKLLVIFVPGILTLVPAAGYLGGWIPGGWRAVPVLYAVLLLAMAAITWWLAPASDPRPAQGRKLKELLVPLKRLRVWRFSLYYVVVFGAYVALSSWLPKFYISTWGVSLHTAAILTASFIFPASLLRPVGGLLSDKFGPRIVTYSVFSAMTVLLVILSLPYGRWAGISWHPTAATFAAIMFLVGCSMGIGKASVYKYIPNYFPQDVGAVGGLVGMLGGLGGFFLPPVFGVIGRATGVPQAACLALLALVLISLAWLHAAVRQLRRSGAEATVESSGAPRVPTLSAEGAR